MLAISINFLLEFGLWHGFCSTEHMGVLPSNLPLLHLMGNVLPFFLAVVLLEAPFLEHSLILLPALCPVRSLPARQLWALERETESGSPYLGVNLHSSLITTMISFNVEHLYRAARRSLWLSQMDCGMAVDIAPDTTAWSGSNKTIGELSLPKMRLNFIQ